MGWIGNKDIYNVKSPLDKKDRLIITDRRTLETKQTLAGDIADLARRASFIAEFDASPLDTTFTNPLFAELELEEIQAFDENGVDILRKPEASKPSVGDAGADTITYTNGFDGKYLFILDTTGNAFVELARKWAMNPEDVPVLENPNEFSALHWAHKAKDAALSPQGSFIFSVDFGASPVFSYQNPLLEGTPLIRIQAFSEQGVDVLRHPTVSKVTASDTIDNPQGFVGVHRFVLGAEVGITTEWGLLIGDPLDNPKVEAQVTQSSDNLVTSGGVFDAVSNVELKGSQYIYVYAKGTDIENAQELQAAYNEAKTMVGITAGNNIFKDTLAFSPRDINNGGNFINYSFEPLEIFPLGVQDVEIVSNNTTSIISIDVTNSTIGSMFFTYSGSQITNVTSIKPLKIKRAIVLAAPGYYKFSTDFIMDEDGIDLLCIDDEKSVIFNGEGTISITANDVFVKGVDVLDKNFTIADDLNLLKIESCKGGAFSFGGDPTFGGTPLTVSGTFTNCVAGSYSFGTNGVASGTFTNCTGLLGSFGSFGTASGTFVNCKGTIDSFGSGSSGVASGVFKNCEGADFSFAGFGGTASGTFIDCVGTGGSNFGRIASGEFINCRGGVFSFGDGGFGSVSSGVFTNCVGGDSSFSRFQIASGVFTNCVGGNFSFAHMGTASGTFINCQSGNNSFGVLASGVIINCISGSDSFARSGEASGDFTNCVAGQQSFAFGAALLSGKLYYCRLTSGTFMTNNLTGNGKIVLGIDGNDNIINQTA